MSLTSANIVRVVTELLEMENLRISINNAVAPQLITGACSVLGALLGGRNGFLVGSAIGVSAVSYLKFDVEYVPVASLITDYLTADQAKTFIEKIILLMPVACTIVTALQNQEFRQKVLSFIKGFIQELGLTLA